MRMRVAPLKVFVCALLFLTYGTAGQCQEVASQVTEAQFLDKLVAKASEVRDIRAVVVTSPVESNSAGRSGQTTLLFKSPLKLKRETTLSASTAKEVSYGKQTFLLDGQYAWLYYPATSLTATRAPWRNGQGDSDLPLVMALVDLQRWDALKGIATVKTVHDSTGSQVLEFFINDEKGNKRISWVISFDPVKLIPTQTRVLDRSQKILYESTTRQHVEVSPGIYFPSVLEESRPGDVKTRSEWTEIKVNQDINDSELAPQIPESTLVDDTEIKTAAEYERLLAKDAKNADLHYNLARAYARAREIDTKIISELEKVAELKPKAAEVYIRLGEMYASRKEDIKADGNFRKAIESDPSNILVYRSIAAQYDRTGRIGELVPVLERGVAANPDKLELANILSRAYEKNGNAQKATELLDNIISQNTDWPDDQDVMRLVRNARKADQLSSLRKKYEEKAGSKDSAPGLYYVLSNIYFELGDKSKSLAALEKAAASVPGAAKRISDLAYTCRRYGANDKALELYAKAIAADPDNWTYLTLRAEMYANIGKKKEAEADYNKAMELAPSAEARQAVQVKIKELAKKEDSSSAPRSKSETKKETTKKHE